MNAALSFSIRLAMIMLLAGGMIRAETTDELIARGDAFAAKYQSSESLKCYLPAEKADPRNVKLLVRISREYRHLMTDATNPEEKLRLGHIAIDYAQRAVALGPEDAEAHLAVAISYGKLQPVEGTRQRIEASRIIKASADKAIRLDPSTDLGWDVLGRWNRNYAEVSPVKRALAQVTYGKLPVTTYEEAARCFEKAIELNPNRLMHYIELGHVYIDMGRPAEARKLINKGLAMRETEKDDPETKREGRELLAKLK